jgi:predicted transcriptional regulator
MEIEVDAAPWPIDEDDLFSAGVRKGIEDADRGHVIDEAEMDARIERILKR